MKIRTQQGTLVDAYTFGCHNNMISCTPKSDKRRKIICGVYDTKLRTGEIIKEMINLHWEKGDTAEYIMPWC